MDSWVDHLSCGVLVLSAAQDHWQVLAANAVFRELFGNGVGDGEWESFWASEWGRSLRQNAMICWQQRTRLSYTLWDWQVTLSPEQSREAVVCSFVPLKKQSAPPWTSYHDAIVVVDRSGIVRHVNGAAEQLFQRSAAEFVGQVFGMPLVSGEHTDVDILQKGGAITAAELRVVEQTQADGITYAIAALRDVTERKRAEELLRLQERAIASSFNGIMIVEMHSPDYPITYVNPSFARMAGYGVEELLGQSATAFLAPDLIQRVQNEGYEGRHLLSQTQRQGHVFWDEVYVSPIYNTWGQLTHLVAIHADVTEQVHARRTLEESEDRLKIVLQMLPHGITFSDAHGRFVLFNAEMERLTGYTQAEANACGHFLPLLHPDRHDQKLAWERLQHLSRTGESQMFETTLRRRDGERRHVLVASA
ncbi:MAG: PAS domain S-box protein [Oscillatoriales cyanobacterium SM2_2_1]|nr:PAS domain S-box protein [Oscillatoriales cyanobacterium SM2_2_1]